MPYGLCETHDKAFCTTNHIIQWLQTYYHGSVCSTSLELYERRTNKDVIHPYETKMSAKHPQTIELTSVMLFPEFGVDTVTRRRRKLCLGSTGLSLSEGKRRPDVRTSTIRTWKRFTCADLRRGRYDQCRTNDQVHV